MLFRLSLGSQLTDRLEGNVLNLHRHRDRVEHLLERFRLKRFRDLANTHLSFRVNRQGLLYDSESLGQLIREKRLLKLRDGHVKVRKRWERFA